MAKDKTLKLSIQIAGKVDKTLQAAINSATHQVSSVAQSMNKIGTAGLVAMGSLATASVAAITQATKAASDFEAQMGDVVKYVDNLADETGKISDKLSENGKTYAENYAAMKSAILDLSTQIPYTAEDLTRLAAAAGQSGKSMEDLIEGGFLRDVAMWGTAMDISADQAGDWAAKWEKAFNMDHEQIMVLADQINYLGANSATTAAEIAEATNAAASLGQIGGVSVSTTVALADAMLATGVGVDRVGTSVKRMITNISKGSSATKAQKEQWAELGLTAEGIAKSMQEDSVATLNTIFDAINSLPKERQVAALSTLFGQWAIEGGAKVVGNLNVFRDALAMVNDPSLYTGSMEREFIIKANTAESIDTMLANTRNALKVGFGDSFLDVKKQFALLQLDFLQTLRASPALQTLAGNLAELASNGIERLAAAMERAAPVIESGIDYLNNNGPEVAATIGKIAAVLVGLKLAPAAEGLLGGAGSLLLGGSGKTGGLLARLTGGGSAAYNNLGTAFGVGRQAAGMANGGLFSRIGTGATGFFAALANMGGLNSRSINARNGAWGNISGAVQNVVNNGLFGAARNGIAGTGIGRYFGGIGTAIGNSRIPGFLSGTANVSGQILSGIAQATGLTDLGNLIKGGALNAAGAIGGKASGLLSAIAGSKTGQAVGGFVGGKALPFLSQIGGGLSTIGGGLLSGAGDMAGILGSVWGPIASGFGSIFAGAAPVIGVISAIIAVVSILGDHLEDIRGIVGNVFGEKGLAIFDGFMGKLQTVGDFITGLFADGGVAAALEPLRGLISNIFGGDENVMAAFDGIVTVLQSVMGVVGQIVNFATTTVKPIIQELFTFITQTAMPIILQAISEAAPYIAGIIGGLGSAVMTGMQIIAAAIQTAMPIIQWLITTILRIGQVVIPAVLAAFGVFASGIASVIENVKGIFEGLITFFKGVFTANWSQAWEGIKQIFGNVFDGLITLCKVPINAVIALINQAIRGINKLGIKIPDWVPVLGGKDFSINIPTIPQLKYGGFTNGPSIAGEAGREAVISFQRSARAENLATWAEAGRMLGAGREFEQFGAPGAFDGETATYTFAPQIIIQGSADNETVENLKEQLRELFEQFVEENERRRKRLNY